MTRAAMGAMNRSGASGRSNQLEPMAVAQRHVLTRNRVRPTASAPTRLSTYRVAAIIHWPDPRSLR